MRYTVRPLSDRTWLRGDHQRTQSRFDSTWTKTLSLLGREVEKLAGRDVVLEVDVQERHIRQDGMLRSDAKAASPAVVVAFETPRHGALLYRCDRYTRGWRSGGTDWQENVRAIALTLESLRAVDRYGATETGQQYAGFKALPAGRALPASHMTATEAAQLLERVAIGCDLGPARDRVVERIQTDREHARVVWREARKMVHPDRRGGDQTMWDQVEQAAAVLGVTR